MKRDNRFESVFSFCQHLYYHNHKRRLYKSKREAITDLRQMRTEDINAMVLDHTYECSCFDGKSYWDVYGDSLVDSDSTFEDLNLMRTTPFGVPVD